MFKCIIVLRNNSFSIDKSGSKPSPRQRWKDAFHKIRKSHKAIGSFIVGNIDSHAHRELDTGFTISDFPKFVDKITDIFNYCATFCGGKVADYIPELATYSPKKFGLSICTVDGSRFDIGDVTDPFPIQSCCKPLNYAISMTERLASDVHKYVGMEPSGQKFNVITLDDEKKPHNPMINAGAIIVTSIIKNSIENMEERFRAIQEFYSKLAGNEHIGYNHKCYLSEKRTGFRNFALGYYMRENLCFPRNSKFEEVMDLYFKLCSVEITAQSGSVIAATLANFGVNPLTNEKLLKASSVRNTLALMLSCGMYDYSGQFAFKVGLPAKSGVSGVVILVIPNVMGICLWSPPLDECGNSVRGVKFCQEFTNKFSFHLLESLQAKTNVKEDPCVRSTMMKTQKHFLLMEAAAQGNIEPLKRLLCGCKDNLFNKANYDGRTALHLAASNGHLKVVKFLVEECKVQVGTRDRRGYTPLDDAKYGNHSHIVEYLKKLDE